MIAFSAETMDPHTGRRYAVHFLAGSWAEAEAICRAGGYERLGMLVAEGELPDDDGTAPATPLM